jgi:hypothetical protein
MATWVNDEKQAGQIPITYNEAGVAYNDSTYQYNGKQQTQWSYETKN